MSSDGKHPMVCWGVAHGPIVRLRLEAAANEAGDWLPLWKVLERAGTVLRSLGSLH